ncbi:hypothetical protein CC1G_00961 [Coprinopsis cinerea okayama7|uniref:ELYS-like domain-containing protein n=1 Tax=Coprinopsis cinerea (strain Okayama-7 / 130 / ATCC MYA-4618 / FGSC 9003) TaxID=240176 RepID=A8N986_COPC7|nr:hypothetical protein CC1G_00961 [Coprinopsis cinerea okayama7\|eukprot:XP_001831414.2 hypothetical protein CC1G_00961 [Coprinopsis cinerea okayama7\
MSLISHQVLTFHSDRDTRFRLNDDDSARLTSTMDEGSTSQHGAAGLIRYFDVSEDGFAWREPCSEQIRERRAAMNDKLIFDCILISGGVRDPDFIYPPHDVAGLTRLLDAIASSSYDTLKKQTLVYFLLKWHQDGREDKFRLQCSIPPQFTALADAYWYVDSGINIGKGVSLLSDSRLNRDHASKIMQAIALSPQSGPLLRKYIRTACPALVEPPDVLRYLIALAESSLFEAWSFQRTFSETHELRPRLFRKLLDWALYPIPQPKALKELISLPLSKYEETLLNDYATKPPEEYSASIIARLQDLVCVRYIELGKYADAIKMDRKFSSNAYDGKDSSDRRNMINELYEALPPVEKSLIDMPIRVEKPKRPQPPANADVSMSQSWEEVRVPENLNKSTSTPLRNIQIPANNSPANASFSVANGTTPAPVAPSAAPVLPLATGPPQPAFTPRKSLTSQPLNPLNSSLGSAKNRTPLSGVGQRLAAGASPSISSPVSGIRFPLQSKPPVQTGHASTSTATTAASIPPPPPPVNPGVPPQPVFKSTTNQPNAFYQPKPHQKQKRTFEEVERSPERNKSEDAEEGDETMQVDESPPKKERREEDMGGQAEEDIPGWKDHDVDESLNKSIFAPQGSPPERISSASVVQVKKASPPSPPQESISAKPKSKQRPPGAFVDEEHDSQSEEEPVSPVSVVSAASGRRRSTARQASASRGKEPRTSTARSTRGRTSRKSKGDTEDLDRCVPGGFTISAASIETEPTDNEEDDQVAPLRPTSPPLTATSKRPARKTRSVASVSDIGDDDGVKTRRRSSRLTASSSLRNLSPESVKGESATAPRSGTKKSSRASTAKKRK